MTIKKRSRKKATATAIKRPGRGFQGRTRKEKPTPKGQPVLVARAKGRPMLTWVGKRALHHLTAFPAQKMETFSPYAAPKTESSEGNSSWPSDYSDNGLLFHGDNKEVLSNLLAHGFREKAKLIYIDPPFDSGADYVRKVGLRGVKGTAKIEGEEYTLGEQIQYTDIWVNDNYLQFIYERLLLLKELLADDGNLFVQADDKRGHYIKLILDEVMGPDNYINDIIWHKGREGGGGTERNPPLPTEYQNIYLYGKNKRNRKWHAPRGPYRETTLQSLEKDDKGWYYMRGRMGRKPAPWEIKAGSARKTYVSNDPDETKEALVKRLTLPGAQHVLIGDVWNSDLVKNSTETDYPTEKPESLLTLIIGASTDPGDIVLDAFVGSGTTAAVAQKMARRWIVCDVNKGAIQTTSKRIQKIILEQGSSEKEKLANPPLVPGNVAQLKPRLSFSIFRVNDYDLSVQLSEATNLAYEHVGITKTRADSFFQGNLGKRLVRMITFDHPLGILDLEEIKKELSTRREEDRDIVVVCLGKELAVDSWLEDWNKLRRKGDVPNKIEIIELRTDPKYGKFFVHKPAQAKVSFTRVADKIRIEIEDFISPTIIERLNSQSGLVNPQIDDWRSMVDVVMIDNNYDGFVFNIVESDVPEGKTDLVKGKYEVSSPKTTNTVAVKIIDMLGEEVLVKKNSG